MPRRNKTAPHQRFNPSKLAHSTAKVAYDTKRDAQYAAKEVSKYNLDLELSVYKSPVDGKWYLSSKTQA